MTPASRKLEDLTVRCEECGAFPAATMFGQRDWLARHRPYDFDAWNEHTDELSQMIEDAKTSMVGKLWNRVRRVTARIDEPNDEDDVDDNGINERDLPAVVTRLRIDSDGDERLGCHSVGSDGVCGGEVPLTWNELIEGHEKLTTAELDWLAAYTRAKDLIRLGLFRNNVGFSTVLGTFSTHRTGELPHAFGGTIAPGAAPVFIPSAQLAKRVGAISPDEMIAQMGGDESCRPTADPDADSLALPIYYKPPATIVDISLPLDVATIASELERDGATPLRGFGVLRLLEVDWISVQGKLVFLDFDEGLRETLVGAERGERW